jgi:hypothetical protein
MQSFLLDVIAKSKNLNNIIERRHELDMKINNERITNNFQNKLNDQEEIYKEKISSSANLFNIDINNLNIIINNLNREKDNIL